MKKRWVSLILAVCMAMSFLPVSAFAETAVGDTFSYEYEGQTLNYKVTGDTTVEVTKNMGITGALKIPDTVYDSSQNKYTVTAIGKDAFYNNNIIDLELPSTLKTIDESAFSCNYNMKNFKIPEGVTTIGAYAFNSIWGATELEIPASVESLAQGSFQWCGNVETITFALGSRLTEIAGGAFYQCEKVKKVVLPDSITKIGGAAFKDCKLLEEIVLPEGLSKIEAGVFAGVSADFKAHYKGSEEQWNKIGIVWSNYKNGGNNDILKRESVDRKSVV